MPARASQALATMLVLLVTCIGPVVASAQPQPAPTPDATIVALNKEKLNQEVEQLKAQNDVVSAMLRSLSPVFIPVVAVAVGALRWREDRKNERDKRDEERFQTRGALGAHRSSPQDSGPPQLAATCGKLPDVYANDTRDKLCVYLGG